MRVSTPARFLKGTGISLEAPAPIRISAAGPFMGPDVNITTSLAGIKAQEADLSDATLKIRASLMEGFTGLKSASVAVNAQELRVQQAPKLKGPLNIHMDAQSPDFSTWRVKNLTMTLQGIDVHVKEALMALTEGSFSGDLQVHAAHIAVLMPPDTPHVDGILDMDAKVKGSGPADLKAQLNLALSRLTGLPPEAADLAGQKVTLAARAELQGDRLKLESVDLLGPQAHLVSSGWLDMKNSTFDVAYEMGLDNSRNGPSNVKDLPVGDMESKGSIAGAFDDFSAQVALVSRKLQINDLEINDMNVRLKASGLPQKPSGEVQLTASAMDQPLSVKTDFAWSGKTLSVKDARVRVPGIDLGATLEFNPETESPSGRIKGQVTSLALLQALAGVAAKGQGTFQIEAHKATTSGNSTSVKLDADFKDLKYQDYGAATLKMGAQLDDIKKMQGRASLKATDIPLGKSRLETFDLNAKGSLSDAEIILNTKGTSRTEAENTSGAPLFLSTKIRAGRTNLWRVHVDSLRGGYENLRVNLQKPTTLTYDDNGRISVDNLQLKTDKGLIQATAEMDQESLTARISIADLPLSLLEPFVGQDLEGKVALNLDLSGPLADPGMRVGIHVKEYKIMGQDMKKPILLNAKLNSRRDGDRLLADLELSGLGNTPFKANGSIPAHISLKPFAFDINKGGNVEGKLLGKFDLAFLQTLPTMSDQNLQGKVDINMGIGGSLEKWTLQGGVTISKGRYENVEQGVLLDHIEGRLDAEGRALKLTRLSATDGGTGTISLNGQTQVDPPFQTNIALVMKNATLLRQETLSVTAGGNLDVRGNKDSMDLTGQIDLERTEIAIPKSFPPDVPVIPVTTINDPASETSMKSEATTSIPIQMDLTVNIPDRFFVRGRGLDVEFKGQLRVKGPADDPVIRGTLNVVKGTFLFLSRTFNVTSGQIAFDGATPPVPFLNINTEVDAGEITAKVAVTGPADAFKLKLSSQPTLPQDEIMAQILFGQSVAKLNTFQALQLAYSVNELAGGYGPDVLGKTRSFLGLDRIGFSGGDSGNSNSDGSDDANGPSVTLGKYVTDRVYIGVEQDLTDAKQDVIVEVNVTPNFTVESKAGSRSGAGIGFNWNYDY